MDEPTNDDITPLDPDDLGDEETESLDKLVEKELDEDDKDLEDGEEEDEDEIDFEDGEEESLI